MDSLLTYDREGNLVSAHGKDAMRWMNAIYLKASLKLYADTDGKIIPTRGMTITKMLALAGKISGKRYKRSQVNDAITDLAEWIDAMKSALPIENRV